MDMLGNILNCIGFLIMAIGVVCVYDARKLTNKFFSSSDANTATRSFKIVGLFIFLIGSGVVIF